MSADPLIEEFYEYMRRERHFTQSSAKKARSALSEFSDILTGCYGNKPNLLANAVAGDVEYFQSFLERRHNAPATVARKLSTLRSFYGFCVQRGFVQTNPTTGIELPKLTRKPRKFLDEEQAKRLIDVIDVSEHRKPQIFLEGVRARALLETMYCTGLTARELADLAIRDLGFIGEKLRIRGCGKKQRIVPISPTALAWIKQYWKFRRGEFNAGQDDPVFIKDKGGRMSADAVRRVIAKYARLAGLPSGVTPEVVRASFARHMLSCGADERLIQEIMGFRTLKPIRACANAVAIT